MRSLYNKVFKNYQVNVGNPFQVKSPLNFQTIKQVNTIEQMEREEMLHQAANAGEIVGRAREEAEILLKEAQLEAVHLLENAESEIEEVRRKVEEEARNTGYEEGVNQARQQYEDLVREAEMIREHAKVEYKEVLAGIEADVVDVVLDIARKVIGAEIMFNREDILYLVKQGFEKCANKDRVILKVCPEDYEYLSENRDRLYAVVEGLGEVELKKDVALQAGSCMIETQYGSIDAGVETKLKKIEEAFRQAIGKG